MANQTLTIDISPTLLDELKVRGRGSIDYFKLFLVERDSEDTARIDQCLIQHSRVMKQWQSSPQYGSEVVRLLTQLHRVAKILKDPHRRHAYREELERLERGESVSAMETFEGLVRAAMADGQMDITVRRELNDYAQSNGLEPVEAEKTMRRVREELKTERASEARIAGEARKDDWEFRLAGEGEEAFGLMLSGMEASGKVIESTTADLMAQASKYGLGTDRAAQMIVDFQRVQYRHMVQRVAGQGAVRDAQIGILLAKAPAYGLGREEAEEVISDYTLTHQSVEDMIQSYSMAETFNQAEIETMISDEDEDGPAGKKKIRASMAVPDWLRNLILLGLGLGALVMLFMWLQPSFQRHRPTPSGVIRHEPASTQVAGGEAAPGVQGTPEPSLTPKPTPEVTPMVMFTTLPDPFSGMLVFKPEKPEDPPAFEISITEVTNAQYYEYLRATLEPGPANWGGERYPQGTAQLPVTGLTWQKALQYCQWLASRRGWDAADTRLPKHGEYLRAIRGKTYRGNPLDTDYWERSRLGQRRELSAIKKVNFDKIFIPGLGQMYDMIGNAAEWGWDEQGGRRALLGGDFRQKDPAFNPLAVRWQAPDTMDDAVGFRVIHKLED